MTDATVIQGAGLRKILEMFEGRNVFFFPSNSTNINFRKVGFNIMMSNNSVFLMAETSVALK